MFLSQCFISFAHDIPISGRTMLDTVFSLSQSKGGFTYQESSPSRRRWLSVYSVNFEIQHEHMIYLLIIPFRCSFHSHQSSLYHHHFTSQAYLHPNSSPHSCSWAAPHPHNAPHYRQARQQLSGCSSWMPPRCLIGIS